MTDGGGHTTDILGTKGPGIPDTEEEEAGYHPKETPEHLVYRKHGNRIYRYEFGRVACDVAEKYSTSELCHILHSNTPEDKEEGKHCVVHQKL